MLIAILLLIGGAMVTQKKSAEKETPALTLHMFDIGQGDALFLETPKKHQILIDGGPDTRVLEKLAAVMPSGDTTIDAVILTHPHADHVAGLPEVLRRYKVMDIYSAGVVYTTDAYLAFLKEAERSGAKFHAVDAPEEMRFDDGARIEFLAPQESFAGKRPKEVHDSMVVARAVYGENAIMLTGDAEAAHEAKILATGASVAVDILKVGHHGSRTSSSEKFLEAMKPKFALISVAKRNDYGHPHAVVMNRLKDLGIETHRTDEEGDLKARCDGKNCTVTTEALRFSPEFSKMMRIIIDAFAW